MKVILANPRGFCAGVNMAIESLEKALEKFGSPIYVYHEIVHNRPVVERFSKRGLFLLIRLMISLKVQQFCTVRMAYRQPLGWSLRSEIYLR